MLIILVSFLVVLIITAAAIGRFSNDIKQDVVMNTAETSKLYFSSLLYSSESDGFSDLDERERSEVEAILKNISLNVDDVSTVVTDKTGNVVFYYYCENSKMEFDGEISAEFLSKISSENTMFTDGDFSGFFSGANILCGAAIENSDGEICGYVFSCSDAIMMSELWELMFKIVMGSILWVLLAALIAVYFISERVIAPLREISNAAKSFAKGKFDVRVPVHGSDEVTELAETFNNMAESLDNYDNMRNTFMSDVSHDLRSPMTSIAGFVDGILDGVIPPEQHEYYLKVVSNEVHRLSRLVSSLLDLSRIQAGVLTCFKEVRSWDKSFDAGMYLIYIFCLAMAMLADLSQLDWKLGLWVLIYQVIIIFGSLALAVVLARPFKVDADSAVITSDTLVNSPICVPMIAATMKNKGALMVGITNGLAGYAVGNYLGYIMYQLLQHI